MVILLLVVARMNPWVVAALHSPMIRTTGNKKTGFMVAEGEGHILAGAVGEIYLLLLHFLGISGIQP